MELNFAAYLQNKDQHPVTEYFGIAAVMCGGVAVPHVRRHVPDRRPHVSVQRRRRRSHQNKPAQLSHLAWHFLQTLFDGGGRLRRRRGAETDDEALRRRN